MVARAKYTLEEFHQFVSRPENADRLFEYIAGEIFEVVSNNYASEIAMFIGSMITVFAKPRKLGRVTGADGGYVIAGHRYIPDVAFISYEKQPERSYAAYNPNLPDLVVEVISNEANSDELYQLRIKITNYLAEGIVVWVVNSERQHVEVYQQGQSVVILGMDDMLDGGDVLPGFLLPVKDIFAL